MPIYEYVCKACGKETEIMQRMSDEPATECPACGKPALTKHISAVGFRLKGAGWYETDFKSGAKKNVAGEASASTTPTAPASSDKPAAAAPAPTPSKPAATPAAG
jgi:putative FmdB family regulatory protein